jgi:hypothetical protein
MLDKLTIRPEGDFWMSGNCFWVKAITEKKYESMLRERFLRAQSEGKLSEEINPAELAKYVATVHQGMSVQAFNGATRGELLGDVNQTLRNWLA